MFSGIVIGTGAVASNEEAPGGRRLVIDMRDIGGEFHEGESVSIDGVCLTVAGIDGETVTFDVVLETLSKTTLGSRGVGSRVNVERSLRVGDPIDGHFVQGHVDAVGQIRDSRATAAEHVVWITYPREIGAYVAPRGSVAVNGVSLTVADIRGEAFAVALIPMTLSKTNLGTLRPGDAVNIETDMLARQVARWLAERDA